MYRFNLANAKYCNCAGCNVELLGASQREHIELAIQMGQRIVTPIVAGRVKDRPYCQYCLATINPPAPHSRITPRQGAKLGSTSS